MYNILICDDDADIRAALRLYLAPDGYGIFEAADGAEALALLARETIHLVLMDLMMPQLDGVSATAQLRGQRIPGAHRGRRAGPADAH